VNTPTFYEVSSGSLFWGDLARPHRNKLSDCSGVERPEFQGHNALHDASSLIQLRRFAIVSERDRWGKFVRFFT